MLSTVLSCGRQGIEGYCMRVEVDVRDGLPMVDVVGLPDAAVRESRERVRTAVKNSGFVFPIAQITVNLAPADIKKEGPWYDLPIALGILASSGQVPPESLHGVLVLGALSLDGSVGEVTGALPMLLAARKAGIQRALLPVDNARQCACLSGIDLYPIADLRAAVGFLRGTNSLDCLKQIDYEESNEEAQNETDLSAMKGQYAARRALEIAASGGHNLLLIGTAGSGKTMLARCLPGILPRMNEQEALETTVIHSVVGDWTQGGLMTHRPFSAPHHTTSAVALIGGGRMAAPGEISKAHNGVLFLDELPEFPRPLLEALRQPMEDGEVTVSRVNARCVYPARFQLVCAMNPCPCGNYGSRTRVCRCAPHEVQRYLNRISGPLLDRIDLIAEMDAVSPEEVFAGGPPAEDSATVRARVERARAIQHKRYEKMRFSCNAHLPANQLEAVCALTEEGRQMLALCMRRFQLSMRGYARVLRVARTLADMEGVEQVTGTHIAEAASYRGGNEKYWK